MGKVESTIRAEVLRLAQKEVRGRLRPFQRELKEVKRQMSRLTQSLAAARRIPAGQGGDEPLEISGVGAGKERGARFSAPRIRALRQKLGLSQKDLAALIGVSTGAVGLWEKGKFSPAGRKLANLAALRQMGKREVQRRLAENRGGPEEGAAAAADVTGETQPKRRGRTLKSGTGKSRARRKKA